MHFNLRKTETTTTATRKQIKIKNVKSEAQGKRVKERIENRKEPGPLSIVEQHASSRLN